MFDIITSRYGIEKIKTIGDAYMAAGGIPKTNSTHPMDVVSAAIVIKQWLADVKALGFDAVELSYKVTDSQLKDAEEVFSEFDSQSSVFVPSQVLVARCFANSDKPKQEARILGGLEGVIGKEAMPGFLKTYHKSQVP